MKKIWRELKKGDKKFEFTTILDLGVATSSNDKKGSKLRQEKLQDRKRNDRQEGDQEKNETKTRRTPRQENAEGS